MPIPYERELITQPTTDKPSQALSSMSGLPLATRMRPSTLKEFLGQEHLMAPGKAFLKGLEAYHIPSMILWGPPGSGKTTLAHIISQSVDADFSSISAVSSGVADLRSIVQKATSVKKTSGRSTILFIDEIHRFSKNQQDAILPHVENGTITFIGATTENPSFEIISPLLSRVQVFILEPLSPKHLHTIMDRALNDHTKGLAKLRGIMTEKVSDYLYQIANGDARIALNTLERAVAATDPDTAGNRVLTVEMLEDVTQRRLLRHDKGGDNHYQLISAYIKSVRGSDPDAAIYWLARLLEAGEDPLFVARRIIILAAEDIGLADPQALSISVATQQAVQFIGMPEAYLPLSEATLYLARAPKSNSSLTAYLNAKSDVMRMGNIPVPLHLRNAPNKLMKDIGYGAGYQYPHNANPSVDTKSYLPKELERAQYYQPNSTDHD